MTYTPTAWVNGTAPAISATNLNHIETGILDAHEMATGRCASFVIAANDSSSLAKQQADYVCTGASDQVQIQAAIDALPSPVGGKMYGGSGGSIVLLPGLYHTSDTIEINKNIDLSGAGMTNTEIRLADNSDCNMFSYQKYNYPASEGACYGCQLKHIKLAGNNINQGVDVTGISGDLCDFYADHVWIDDFDYGIASTWMWSSYFNQLSIEQCGEAAIFINAMSGKARFVTFTGLFCDGPVTIRSVVAGGYAKSIFISDSCFGRDSGGNYHRIKLEGNVSDVHIYNNRFRDNTPAGYYDIYTQTNPIGEVDTVSITDNHFKSVISDGSIYLYDACDNINVSGNIFSHALPIVQAAGANAGGMIRANIGFVTEKSGTATLVSGTTSIAVTHGLAVTPIAGDIAVTPIEAWGSMTQFYIDTYTATQFTIHADQNPTQDVDFAWKAIVL